MPAVWRQQRYTLDVRFYVFMVDGFFFVNKSETLHYLFQTGCYLLHVPNDTLTCGNVQHCPLCAGRWSSCLNNNWYIDIYIKFNFLFVKIHKLLENYFTILVKFQYVKYSTKTITLHTPNFHKPLGFESNFSQLCHHSDRLHRFSGGLKLSLTILPETSLKKWMSEGESRHARPLPRIVPSFR